MPNRCATRSYLKLVASDRKWKRRASTTQLIAGTMLAYLRITEDYAVSPDDRAFMIYGTKAHMNLESYDDEFSLIEEKFDDIDTTITGIMDVFEQENGKSVLVDYKTSGSYKVAKAMGWYTYDELTGEVYKSGKRKGQPKTRKVLARDDAMVDMWEWELQLNKYRMELERRGFAVDEMRIQCIVRDGNTWIARSRGVFRNLYFFLVKRLPDEEVDAYFWGKNAALMKALEQGYWKEPCSGKENWDGIRCARYCEVAEFCPLGKYLQKEREEVEMPIKGLSDVRRLPRLGKIRLGVKKKNSKGVEYPSEVDYFIPAPSTPSELENERLIDQFKELYGEEPKSINVMLPLADPEQVFPQWYKRYGKSTLLQCKGDGEKAVCISKEYAKDLNILGEVDRGLEVECLGKECPYYQAKKCSEVATLQVLLPELEGAGVWQITTGSYHSIVNINSGIDYIRAMAGRINMIPLKLERREQEIQYEGKKSKHYILHLNISVALAELQRMAQLDPTKILMELPEVAESKEDIIFEQTPPVGNGAEIIEAEIVSTNEAEPGSLGPVEIAEKLAGMMSGMKVNGYTFTTVCPDDLLEYVEAWNLSNGKLVLKLMEAVNDDSKFTKLAKAFGEYMEKKVKDDADAAATEDFFPKKNGISKNPQHLSPEEMQKASK